LTLRSLQRCRRFARPADLRSDGARRAPISEGLGPDRQSCRARGVRTASL